VHFATNSSAADLERTIAPLKAVPDLTLLPLDLGEELQLKSGSQRKKAARNNAVALSKALVRLRRHIRRHRIQIVHCGDRPRDAMFGVMLARVSGARSVVHMHVKWWPEMGRASNWALTNADGILAISEFVRGSLVEGGLPRRRIHMAHNSTDPELFNPHHVGRLRSDLGLPSDTPLICLVGRLLKWKGHAELLEAVDRLRRRKRAPHTAFVGKMGPGSADSRFETEMREKCTALGLDEIVHWAGWYDNSADVFADADAACVPSWEEPFGLVVTEAMAMQKPVTAFHGGAIPEIITNRHDGVLTPVRDVDALADALDEMLTCRDLRTRLGRNARETVLSRFSPQHQASAVCDIYQRVVNREAAV
jgi:glycosyltransferase involved in cell wall biosynthesis